GAVACEQGYCVDSNDQRIDSAAVTSGGTGGSGGGTGKPTACDPLAPHELPITLGKLLGAGKDATGTVFAPAHEDDKNTDRVFVSAGDTLYRKHLLGSGSSGGGADVDYNFNFDDAAGQRFLLIQRRGGNVTAVALGSTGKQFISDSGDGSQPLTVIGSAE